MQIKSYVERVVICLNEDGSLKAAHQETLHQIIRDDGTPLPGGGSMEPAATVDESTIAGIVDQAASVAQVSKLQAELNDAKEQARKVQDRNEKLSQHAMELREELNRVNQELAKARGITPIMTTSTD